MASLTLRLDNSLLARVAQLALKKGTTHSEVARRALTFYLEERSDTALEEEVAERASRKRIIDLATDKPKMLHDGVRFSQTIWESIEEEKEGLALFKDLDERDYEHFRAVVAANKQAAQQYENSENIVRWLDSIDRTLEMEKKNIPPRELLLQRYWAKRGIKWEAGILVPIRRMRSNQR